MTYTRAIGVSCNKVIRLIVHGLALSKISPNVLTFIGLVINIVAGVLLAAGQFRTAGFVIIGAGLFDMVDGRVARETNRVTRFGGFFDPDHTDANSQHEQQGPHDRLPLAPLLV